MIPQKENLLHFAITYNTHTNNNTIYIYIHNIYKQHTTCNPLQIYTD